MPRPVSPGALAATSSTNSLAANDQWDPTKAAAPDVAWGAANVEFATKSSRRILRVLAVMVKENDEWRLVQTQWSDGG